MEALQANVERLNAYKSKLVVFPKSGKAEEATQFQGVFMPVEKVASHASKRVFRDWRNG